MSKHKDISIAHALLEGEGWHIIKPNQGNGTRRDKRKCIYYNKNLKSCRLNCLCTGSSGCTKYREKY